jgi:signal transduction histidine kinase
MIIYSDSKIIREILNNLVNNAIKYTNSGSVIIQATINFELNKLFLSVSDTGIGIPEDKVEIIFEEFRQASEGLSRSFEGVGLGLAICKKYVQILKGSISVKSKINQGSTFIVEIPLYKKD